MCMTLLKKCAEPTAKNRMSIIPMVAMCGLPTVELYSKVDAQNVE
jgi:hypothetical protein